MGKDFDLIISLEDSEAPEERGYIIRSNGRIADTLRIGKLPVDNHNYALWFFHRGFKEPESMGVVAIGHEVDEVLDSAYRKARGRAREHICGMGAENHVFIDNTSRGKESSLLRVCDSSGNVITGPKSEMIERMSFDYKEHPAPID